jgi:hypothetical protein
MIIGVSIILAVVAIYIVSAYETKGIVLFLDSL